MFLYLIKSTLVLSVFYLIYRYIFNKYFYFEWNRFYLISIVFLSLVLPLIKINYFNTSSLNIETEKILFVNFTDGQFFVNTTEQQNIFTNIYSKLTDNKYFTIFNVLLIIYLSGIFRFSIIFIKNLTSLVSLKNKSKKIAVNLYEIKSRITAFSFFKNIFVSKNFENLTANEQQQIINHENIHIKQKHSLDNLLFEILNIIFWFNPLIKKLKKSVKENHEFIVDKILTKKDSTYNYSYLMLKLTKKKVSINNNIKSSQVKDRIKLMANPEKERIKKIRFIATMPLLILIIFTFLFAFNLFNKDKKILENDKSEFIFPIANDYKIITGFIEEQIIEDPENKDIRYKISHKKITIQANDFSNVLAIGKGIVVKIDTINDWGLDEINITIDLKNNYKVIYEKLAKTSVAENEKIKKGQIIGQTGDKRLYSSINYQLILNDKSINPLE